MPGFLLHVGARVLCSHAGQATPMASNPRVLIDGQAIVTQTTPFGITGCTLPTNAGGPCVTAQWITGSTRILSNGQPALLLDSRAICAPTGTPLVVAQTQVRVTGM